MRNPENPLQEDQSTHFAKRFFDLLQESLVNDPYFQRACAEAILDSPSSPRELSAQGITFDRGNGVELCVHVKREVDKDELSITRYSGGHEKGNFNAEAIHIGVWYDQVYEDSCNLWGGTRGKPRLGTGTIQYSQFWPREKQRDPVFNTNDHLALRGVGRFIRENFPDKKP